MGAAYNITPIGWEASQKKLLPGEKAGRWKVVFNYQDYQKQLLAAGGSIIRKQISCTH
jgi:hypothetical protein